MNEEHVDILHNSPSGVPGSLPLVVAVDLGGTQIRAAVLRGTTLLARVGLLTGDNPAPDLVIPRICQAIEHALSEAHLSLEQIAGIGVGAPGPLNSRTGIVYDPPNLPGWNGVPLRDILNGRFNVPVFVENDANAAALGEYMFGAGRGCQNIVYLTVSTGIGGGVIIDGKLLEGVSGTAAELGHISIDWRGGLCNCGNRGCLEYLASGTAIARRANTAIAQGQGKELLEFAMTHLRQKQTEEDPTRNTLHVSAHTVALAAEEGIPLAQEIIASTAEALGVGIVSVIHIFNPEMVILGGGVMQIGERLLGPARKIVQERAMRVPREAVKIMQAQLGYDVGLVGAGALIYHYK